VSKKLEISAPFLAFVDLNLLGSTFSETELSNMQTKTASLNNPPILKSDLKTIFERGG
jgi:hypothetical protein